MNFAEDNNHDLPLEDFLLQDEELEFISVPAWRTQDGTLIAIRDMETSHIKNCIKMIYRSNGRRHQYLRLFEDELRFRKFNK